jgi:5-methylcytosine-specific restriction endonuclease McrA
MERKRQTIRKHVRDYVVERDRGRCRYCGQRCEPRWVRTGWGRDESGYWRDPYCIDHITPHAKGGSDHPANLVTACEDCNLRKYDNEWAPLPVPGE